MNLISQVFYSALMHALPLAIRVSPYTERSFRTIDWLLQALHNAGPPDFIIKDILERLRENATQTFREHPALRTAPQEAKKLSIMFSGFIYGNSFAQPGYAILSNYVNLATGHQYVVTQDDFEIQYFTANTIHANPTLIKGASTVAGGWQ